MKDEGGGREEGTDTELKTKKHTSMWGTRTPHKDVGKKKLRIFGVEIFGVEYGRRITGPKQIQ